MDIFSYCVAYCLFTEQNSLLIEHNHHLASVELLNQNISSNLAKSDRLLIIAQAPFLNKNGKKVVPIDEAEVNPDFLKFRQQ